MSMMDIYNSLASKFSRNQYTPALAAAELACLVITYVAGMGIPIFKLPLQGGAITAHIYAAAFDVIFALSLYGSSTRAGNLILRILSVLDILSVLGAAFMGIFYFGGFIAPEYAMGMGVGFILTIVFTSVIMFYGMKDQTRSRNTPALIASVAETLILILAFSIGTATLLYAQFPIVQSWMGAILTLHTSFGLLAGLGGALIFTIGYLGNNKTFYRLALLTVIFVAIAAAGGLLFYVGYYYVFSYVMALSLLVAIITSSGCIIESL